MFSFFGSFKKPIEQGEKEKEEREMKMAQMQAVVRQNIFPTAEETRNYVILHDLDLFRRQIRRQPPTNLPLHVATIQIFLKQILVYINIDKINPNPNAIAIAIAIKKAKKIIKLGAAKIEEKRIFLSVIAPKAWDYYTENKDLIFRRAIAQFLTEKENHFEAKIYRYLHPDAENQYKTQLINYKKENKFFVKIKENIGLVIFDRILLLIYYAMGNLIPTKTFIDPSIETRTPYIFEKSFAAALYLLYDKYSSVDWGFDINKEIQKRKPMYETPQKAIQKELGLSDMDVEKASEKAFGLSEYAQGYTMKEFYQKFYQNVKLESCSKLTPLTMETLKTYLKAAQKNPSKNKWEIIEINTTQLRATGKYIIGMMPSRRIYYTIYDIYASYVITTGKETKRYYSPEKRPFITNPELFDPTSIANFKKDYSGPVNSSSIKYVEEFVFFIGLLTSNVEDFEVFEAFKKIDGFDCIMKNLYSCHLYSCK